MSVPILRPPSAFHKDASISQRISEKPDRHEAHLPKISPPSQNLSPIMNSNEFEGRTRINENADSYNHVPQFQSSDAQATKMKVDTARRMPTSKSGILPNNNTLASPMNISNSIPIPIPHPSFSTMQSYSNFQRPFLSRPSSLRQSHINAQQLNSQFITNSVSFHPSFSPMEDMQDYVIPFPSHYPKITRDCHTIDLLGIEYRCTITTCNANDPHNLYWVLHVFESPQPQSMEEDCNFRCYEIIVHDEVTKRITSNEMDNISFRDIVKQALFSSNHLLDTYNYFFVKQSGIDLSNIDKLSELSKIYKMKEPSSMNDMLILKIIHRVDAKESFYYLPLQPVFGLFSKLPYEHLNTKLNFIEDRLRGLEEISASNTEKIVEENKILATTSSRNINESDTYSTSKVDSDESSYQQLDRKLKQTQATLNSLLREHQNLREQKKKEGQKISLMQSKVESHIADTAIHFKKIEEEQLTILQKVKQIEQIEIMKEFGTLHSSVKKLHNQVSSMQNQKSIKKGPQSSLELASSLTKKIYDLEQQVKELQHTRASISPIRGKKDLQRKKSTVTSRPSTPSQPHDITFDSQSEIQKLSSQLQTIEQLMNKRKLIEKTLKTDVERINRRLEGFASSNVVAELEKRTTDINSQLQVIDKKINFVKKQSQATIASMHEIKKYQSDSTFETTIDERPRSPIASISSRQSSPISRTTSKSINNRNVDTTIGKKSSLKATKSEWNIDEKLQLMEAQFNSEILELQQEIQNLHAVVNDLPKTLGIEHVVETNQKHLDFYQKISDKVLNKLEEDSKFVEEIRRTSLQEQKTKEMTTKLEALRSILSDLQNEILSRVTKNDLEATKEENMKAVSELAFALTRIGNRIDSINQEKDNNTSIESSHAESTVTTPLTDEITLKLHESIGKLEGELKELKEQHASLGNMEDSISQFKTQIQSLIELQGLSVTMQNRLNDLQLKFEQLSQNNKPTMSESKETVEIGNRNENYESSFMNRIGYSNKSVDLRLRALEDEYQSILKNKNESLKKLLEEATMKLKGELKIDIEKVANKNVDTAQKSDIEKAQKDIESLSNSLSKLSLQTKENKDYIEKLLQNVSQKPETKVAINGKNRDIETLFKEHTKSIETINQLYTEVSALTKITSQLKAKIQSTEVEINEHISNSEAEKGSFLELKNKNQQLFDQFTSVQQRIGNIEVEIQKYKEKSKLKREKDLQEMRALKVLHDTTNNRVMQTSTSSGGDISVEVTALKSKLDFIEKQFEDLKRMISQTALNKNFSDDEEMTVFRDKIGCMEEQLENIIRNTNQKSNFGLVDEDFFKSSLLKVDTMTAELQSHSSRIKNLEDEFEYWKSLLTDLSKDNYNEKIDELWKVTSTLENEINQFANLRHEDVQRVDELVKKIAHFESELGVKVESLHNQSIELQEKLQNSLLQFSEQMQAEIERSESIKIVRQIVNDNIERLNDLSQSIVKIEANSESIKKLSQTLKEYSDSMSNLSQSLIRIEANSESMSTFNQSIKNLNENSEKLEYLSQSLNENAAKMNHLSQTIRKMETSLESNENSITSMNQLQSHLQSRMMNLEAALKEKASSTENHKNASSLKTNNLNPTTIAQNDLTTLKQDSLSFHWSKRKGSDMEVRNNGRDVIRSNHKVENWQSILGDRIFNEGDVCEWTITIVDACADADIFIGVADPNETELENQDITDYKQSFVYYAADGATYNAGKEFDYGSELFSGSQLKIKLDLKRHTLSFHVNNVDLGIAFTNVHGPLAPIISMNYEDNYHISLS